MDYQELKEIVISLIRDIEDDSKLQYLYTFICLYVDEEKS